MPSQRLEHNEEDVCRWPGGWSRYWPTDLQRDPPTLTPPRNWPQQSGEGVRRLGTCGPTNTKFRALAPGNWHPTTTATKHGLTRFIQRPRPADWRSETGRPPQDGWAWMLAMTPALASHAMLASGSGATESHCGPRMCSTASKIVSWGSEHSRWACVSEYKDRWWLPSKAI